MLPRVVTTGVVTHGEPIVYVEPKDVPIMLRFLRDHTGTRCKQLVDITAVDIPTREKRFEVGPPPAPHTPLLGRAPPAAHRTAPRTAPHRAPHRTAHRAPPPHAARLAPMITTTHETLRTDDHQLLSPRP